MAETQSRASTLLIPWALLIWFHEAFPNWLTILLAIGFFSTLFGPQLLLVFGPAKWRDSFPPTRRVLTKMSLSALAV